MYTRDAKSKSLDGWLVSCWPIKYKVPKATLLNPLMSLGHHIYALHIQPENVISLSNNFKLGIAMFFLVYTTTIFGVQNQNTCCHSELFGTSRINSYMSQSATMIKYFELHFGISYPHATLIDYYIVSKSIYVP